MFAVAAVVGTALAANSASFSDKTGDAGSDLDITSIGISNDDSGTVTIRVAIVGRAALAASDEIGMGIDVDQNPDTGTMFYGSEYGVGFFGPDAVFLRAAPSGFLAETAKPSSYRASYEGGTATFTFNAADIGLSLTSGFEVHAYGVGKERLDTAPDLRTVNYQMVAGTPAPTLGPDKRPPRVEALRSSGTHGKNVELPYFVRDGRAESAETIRVFKGKKLLRVIRYSLADTNPFFEYFARWKAPKKVKGKLRFCVNSVDRAGNKSNTSCAALTIK